MRTIWGTRLSTFMLWMLAAGSISYWFLQTTTRSKPSAVLARADIAGAKLPNLLPDTQAVAQALGAIGNPPSREIIDPPTDTEAAPEAPDTAWNESRFRLAGIMAQGSAKDGLVMLSVDGKPSLMLRVGASVEPGIVVQGLTRQSVTLANIKKPDDIKTITLTLGASPTRTGNNLAYGSAPNSFTSPDGGMNSADANSGDPVIPPPPEPPALPFPQAQPNVAPSIPGGAPSAVPGAPPTTPMSPFAERLRRLLQQQQGGGGNISPIAPPTMPAPVVVQPRAPNADANNPGTVTRNNPAAGAGSAPNNNANNNPAPGNNKKSGNLLHFSD